MRHTQRTGIDHYAKVREAALHRDQADTSRTWALADAILAMIPAEEQTVGLRRGSVGASGDQRELISERLDELADRLYDDGITQPNGGTYSVSALKSLRKTAMAWPKADRHDQAAFRTHQEAGAKDGNGRVILSALCSLARGERVSRPVGLTDAKKNEICTPEAWGEVKRAIAKRKGKTYPVSANDLRRCLDRKPNVPTPEEPSSSSSSGGSSGGSSSSKSSTPQDATSEAEERQANDGAQTPTEVALSAFTLFGAFTAILNRQQEIIAALSAAQSLTDEDRDALDEAHRQVLDNESIIGVLLGEKPSDEDFQRLLEETR